MHKIPLSSSTGIVAKLVAPEVVAMEAQPSLSFVSELYPEELAIVENAIDKRKAEFATARVLARRALAQLGVPKQSLCPYEDRSPRWPVGIVGSITHTTGFCAVVVARASQVKSIGLDVEEGAPPRANITSMICSDAELRWIGTHAPTVQGHLAKLIFSAKEAVYKCQYPLTKTFLKFSDVELEFDEANRRFRLTLLRGIDPEQVIAREIEGNYLLSSELIVTTASIRLSCPNS